MGWQISSVHPENRAGDEATVSVRCAVCTEVSVQRSGECSVLVMFFSFSPLMYRLKVCLEPLYMLRSCVACMETTAMLTGTTTGQRANECLKQKKNPREEGRRVGMGEGKKRIGALWRMDAPVHLPIGLCKF